MPQQSLTIKDLNLVALHLNQPRFDQRTQGAAEHIGHRTQAGSHLCLGGPTAPLDQIVLGLLQQQAGEARGYGRQRQILYQLHQLIDPVCQKFDHRQRKP